MERGVVKFIFLLTLSLIFLFSFASAATRNCYSCNNCTNEIANSSSGDIIQLNNSLNTTINCIDAGSKSNFVLNCVNFSNYIMGDAVGVDLGINFTSSSNITIQNCNVSRFNRGLSLFFAGNITINNSLFNVNHFGVYFQNSSDNKIENISASYAYAATFHLSQLTKDNSWKEVYVHRFNTVYSTQKFNFDKVNSKVVLRIVQRELPFGDVEQIKLDSCIGEISPEYAKYVDNGKSVVEDIKKIDNNAIVAHEREIEISWKIPFFCIGKQIVSLTANEYQRASPFRFPEFSGFVDYSNSQAGKINVDGLITPEDNLGNYSFNPYWVPGTGHPNGNTYIYTKEDDENIYLSADITMDNTDDVGEDWIKLLIKTEKGEKEFKIDDYNKKYGVCGFGLTDKVNYRHQTCEFKIPKKEIGTNKFNFALYYYGTGGMTGGAGLFLTYSNRNSVKNSNFNYNNNIGVSGIQNSYNNFTNINASHNELAGGMAYGFWIIQNNLNNIFDGITTFNNSYLGFAVAYANNSIMKNFVIINNSRFFAAGQDGFQVGGENLSVSNITVSGSYEGMYFGAGGQGTNIANVTITNCTTGMVFYYSQKNNATNVRLENNIEGISVFNSNKIIMSNFTIRGSTLYGIKVQYNSTDNILTNSFIQYNSGSAFLMNSSLFAPQNNSFYNNYFNNSVSYSNVSASLVNFFNTTKTLGANIAGGNYIGGNYWAAPNGSGFSQTCTASTDGICDTSYNLDGVNFDYLPLTCIESWSCGAWGTCYSNVQTRTCRDANLCQTYKYKPTESQSCNSDTSPVTAPSKGGSTSAIIPQATPEQPVTLTINSSDMDLTSITLNLKQNVTNGSISIKFKTGNPDLEIGLPSGKTYQSFQVNSVGFDSTTIINSTFNFRINKTWLAENNITVQFNPNGDYWLVENGIVGNVKLFRVPVGAKTAVPLNVQYSNQDSSYYYFSALSPGFSTFIVFFNKYDCLPNSARCEDNKVQLCLGNSTWLVMEHCSAGCGDRKCAESFFVSEQFYTVLVTMIMGSIMIVLILLRKKFKGKGIYKPYSKF